MEECLSDKYMMNGLSSMCSTSFMFSSQAFEAILLSLIAFGEDLVPFLQGLN